MAPVVVFVGFELAKIVAQYVGKISFPSVSALVSMQTIAERLVGDALHVDVQCGVHPQPAFVHGFRAVGGFQILANLLEKVWREVVARILNVQTQRRFSRSGFIRRRDLAFFFHAVDHQISAVECEFGIGER